MTPWTGSPTWGAWWGRVATYAFVRTESVLVERCGGPALVVDCGSILADAATVRAPELSTWIAQAAGYVTV
jgi:hypothetical protein